MIKANEGEIIIKGDYGEVLADYAMLYTALLESFDEEDLEFARHLGNIGKVVKKYAKVSQGEKNHRGHRPTNKKYKK